jgi:cytochrome c-type protein NapB
MRGSNRARVTVPTAPRRHAASVAVAVLALLSFVTAACAGGWVADEDGNLKRAATVRAERRAYDGAPPVAPHSDFGMTCTQCHNEIGMEVPEVGYAPPSPHELTAGMSAMSRCRQCHVFQQTTDVFVANAFAGLRQDLRRGRRLNDLSPPVIPHKLQMRENCSACHTGVAAREEIRTSHPERARCVQCHVPQLTGAEFSSGLGARSQ